MQPLKNKRVLILGGTSFFGKDIARHFLDAGASVALYTRGNVAAPELTNAQRFVGDRKSASDLKKLSKDTWDIVVDNIGYDASDMSALIPALPKAKHFIFTSTVSVYRYAKGVCPQPLREENVDFSFSPPNEDPSNIHWKYARGKMEAEKYVIEKCQVPWTIVRPPVVYGPEDPTERGFWYLARLGDGGPILLADSGVQSFRISYRRDVARAFFEIALQAKKTQGQIYNVAQSEVITLRDFIGITADCMKVHPEMVSVPRAHLGELGGPYAADIMVNHIPDISKAMRDFGHEPTNCETFLRETAHWFQNSFRGSFTKLLQSRPAELQLAGVWRRFPASASHGA